MKFSSKVSLGFVLAVAAIFGATAVRGGTGLGNPRFVPFKAESMTLSGKRPADWTKSDVGDWIQFADARETVAGESSFVRMIEWNLNWIENAETLKTELNRWRMCDWQATQVGGHTAYRCGDMQNGEIGVFRESGKILFLHYTSPDDATYEERLRPVLDSLTFEN